jgi:hypothetical protein
MKLENLKDFEWYNEPENVLFTDHEMKIVARPQTDFWQSRHHQISKDNGHFFHQVRFDDFCCVAECVFDRADAFNQCGLMVRIDAENWFKMSVMSSNAESPEIGTCLTQCGCSDWAADHLESLPEHIWYKLLRRGSDYAAFYSLDGQDFKRVRQFSFIQPAAEVETGAYFCAPGASNFGATLCNIDITD